METKPSAKIIAHSKTPSGEELITMEIELHRFVLPEFNTHRTFSRNFQSSRAVPVEKLIEQVRNDPAMPVHWGKNQRGMVAEEELDYFELEKAKKEWRDSARMAAYAAENMMKLGAHKQITNRLLEPFMWTKGVVTATRTAFEAFFLLRSHRDAQPEIKALSDQMKRVLGASVPTKLEYGEYHLPYVKWYRNFGSGKQNPYEGDYEKAYCMEEELVEYSIDQAIKISTSCCAQVSYRSLDDSLEKAEKIYDMLNLPKDGKYGDNPPHFSPTEHIVKIVNPEDADLNEDILLRTTGFEALENMSGNFHNNSFWQYRKALEVGLEDLFISNK